MQAVCDALQKRKGREHRVSGASRPLQEWRWLGALQRPAYFVAGVPVGGCPSEAFGAFCSGEGAGGEAVVTGVTCTPVTLP